MKIPENIFINVFFSLFMFIMILFHYLDLLITNVDYIFASSAIIISLLLIFVKNNTIIDIVHFLYCCVYLYSVALFSDNKYLILLNIIMIVNIIFSRYYYNCCILDNKQKHEGFFYNIDGYLKSLIPHWNWDYLLLLTILVSLINFSNVYKIKII